MQWIKRYGIVLPLSQLLLAALIVIIFMPGARTTEGPLAFLVLLALMEILWLRRLLLAKKRGTSLKAPSDVICVILVFLLAWEICCTKLGMTHPVLIPSPENVFYAFPQQWDVMLKNVLSSLELLVIGIIGGMGLGAVLGVIFGWIPRLRDLTAPIARVIAPIPPAVYSPYLIALAPSFRFASTLTVLLGVFFPTLLSTILRVESMEPNLLESARSLALKDSTMVGRILLPYITPGLIASLKVTLSTSMLLLVFAEMMGATSGMGYYIVNYNTYGNYTNVVAGVIVVGIVVFVLYRLAALLEKLAGVAPKTKR